MRLNLFLKLLYIQLKRNHTMKRNQINYNIHNLLTIVSDFNCYIPSYFKTPSELNNPDIILHRKKVNVDKESKSTVTTIAPNLYLQHDLQLVASCYNLASIKARWALRNLVNQPTEVYLSSSYTKISKKILKIPISTVFPADSYVQMIMHIKFLLKDHTFLIGASFQPNDSNSAILISSMGGMGKTTTLLNSLKNVNGNFLSDDMVIINKNGIVYSYPKPIRIRQLKVGPLSVEKYLPPDNVIGASSIINSSRIGTVCILERGKKNEIKPINRKEAESKLLAITRKLLPYYIERTVLAYSYMDASFNLIKIMQKEVEIIRNFIKHSNPYILRCNYQDSNSYTKLLKELLYEYQ